MNLKMVNFLNTLIQEARDSECPYNVCGQDDMWYEQQEEYVKTLKVGVSYYGDGYECISSSDLEDLHKQLKSEFLYILDNLEHTISDVQYREAEEEYENAKN